MASSSKKLKKATTQAESDVESVDSSTKVRYCIICSEKASTKIVKNHDFDAMIQLYWCTLGVDVKPEACNKSDLCTTCFNKVVNYFETNDIIVYFETYFKSLRLELLKTTLKGIATLEKDETPLSRIQREIKKKYIDGPDITKQEEEQIKQTLKTYDMKTFMTNEDESVMIDLKKKTDVKEKPMTGKLSIRDKGGKITPESSGAEESD